LHAAAENGNTDIIHLLLLSGADLHTRSDDGKLPLDLAEAKGNKLAVEMLKREITKRFRSSVKPG
jgi:ankyrin repeat protein